MGSAGRTEASGHQPINHSIKRALVRRGVTGKRPLTGAEKRVQASKTLIKVKDQAASLSVPFPATRGETEGPARHFSNLQVRGGGGGVRGA